MAGSIVIKREETILTITVLRDFTDQEHAAHLAQLSDIIVKGKVGQVHRWVVVHDLRAPIQPNARHRSRQAEWMQAHQPELRYRTAGIGFVMNSVLMRGGLTAILWLAPLPCPHGVFSTMPEALFWARERSRLPVDASLYPEAIRSAQGA